MTVGGGHQGDKTTGWPGRGGPGRDNYRLPPFSPRASLVAQTIICLQCRRPRFNPWVGKIPWRRGWQPTPIVLTREIHGQRRQAGYSPWGCKELDMTEQLTHTHTHTCEIWTWGGKVCKRGTVKRGAWYGILGARKGDVQGPRSLDVPPSGRGLCFQKPNNHFPGFTILPKTGP